MSREDVSRCDDLLEKAGFEGKSLTWNMLAYEANISVSKSTIQREMHQLDWWRCIACRRGWISPTQAKRRVDWAENALFLRLEPKD